MKHRITIWPSKSILRYYPGELRTRAHAKNCTRMFIASLFTVEGGNNPHVHQWMKCVCKQSVIVCVHISLYTGPHNGTYILYINMHTHNRIHICMYIYIYSGIYSPLPIYTHAYLHTIKSNSAVRSEVLTCCNMDELGKHNAG